MKKGKSDLKIVETLLIFGVIAVMGLIGWILFDPTKNTNVPGNTNQQEAATNNRQKQPTNLQPEDVIAKIKITFTEKYIPIDIDENNQPDERHIGFRNSTKTPAYKVDGYDFYIDYNKGSTLDIVPGLSEHTFDQIPRQADMSTRKDVATTYKNLGLTKVSTERDQHGNAQTDIYTGSDIICSIESPTAQTTSNTASCGKISMYREAAKDIKPLADTIPDVRASTVFATPTVTKSPVSGYEKVHVRMGDMYYGGGSVALLYRKTTGPWVYFKNAQQSIDCSEYNTDDLKNAFKDDPCYSPTDPEAVVR